MEVKQVNSEYRLFKEFAVKQEMWCFCWLQLGQTMSIKGKEDTGEEVWWWQLLGVLS